MSIADHAADAAALLEQLGVRRAHVAGHSSGAAVAAQLALDRPETVHTLILLELSLLSVPSGEAFLEQTGPAFAAYENGDPSGALAVFMGAVSGLDWTTCQALLEKHVPGAVAQAIEDAETFFGIELPALTTWEFSADQAAAVQRPVLSVLGAETRPLWVEIAEFLRCSLPHVEECTIDGVGHLLHIQRPEPVAQTMAQFLTRNSIAGDDARRLRFDNPAQPLIVPRAERAASQSNHSGAKMPLTNVKLIEPVSTPCQKCEIVERLTDAMVSSRARTCSQ